MGRVVEWWMVRWMGRIGDGWVGGGQTDVGFCEEEMDGWLTVNRPRLTVPTNLRAEIVEGIVFLYVLCCGLSWCSASGNGRLGEGNPCLRVGLFETGLDLTRAQYRDETRIKSEALRV